MKPSWGDAPDWANWLAMDANRGWYWYSTKPERAYFSWFSEHVGIYERAHCVEGADWRDTLEERPKK